MDSATYYVFAFFVFLITLIRISFDSSPEEGWERKLREIKQRHRRETLERRKQLMEHENTMETNNNNEIKPITGEIQVEIGTRDLLIRTLQEMGCPVKIGDHQNIEFAYQGQQFIALAANELLCIDIIYPWWHSCSLFDVEYLGQLKKAINEVNSNGRVCTYSLVSNEQDTVGVHSRKNLLFIPQIPNLTDYLQAMLADFFRTRHHLEAEMEKTKSN